MAVTSILTTKMVLDPIILSDWQISPPVRSHKNASFSSEVEDLLPQPKPNKAFVHVLGDADMICKRKRGIFNDTETYYASC